MGEQQETKRIVVVGCSPRFSGRQGKVEFTVYDVRATKPSGDVIDVPLRSFEDLPHEEMDVTVVPYHSQNHGISYTLARIGTRVATRKVVEKLTQEVEELSERVAALEMTGGSNAGTT